MRQHHYPIEEYERFAGAPLPAWRLAQIWADLPERQRLSFILSLTEELCDELLILTAPPAQQEEQDATES